MFTYGQVTVIDDFIDKDYQEKIKLQLLGGFDKKNKHHDSDFPWFYIEDVTAAGDEDSPVSYTHLRAHETPEHPSRMPSSA